MKFKSSTSSGSISDQHSVSDRGRGAVRFSVLFSRDLVLSNPDFVTLNITLYISFMYVSLCLSVMFIDVFIYICQFGHKLNYISLIFKTVLLCSSPSSGAAINYNSQICVLSLLFVEEIGCLSTYTVYPPLFVYVVFVSMYLIFVYVNSVYIMKYPIFLKCIICMYIWFSI